MGRTSTFRKAGSGGKLNNVDGTITGYKFYNKFPFEIKNPGKGKKSDFESLYMVLSARVDGAEKDDTHLLWGGDASIFEISADGQTLTPVVDGAVLSGGTPLSKFIETYESFGEGASGDDETVINFEPIVGQRVRFVQQLLSADEITDLKRRGRPYQQVDKKDPKKFWPIKELVVAAVYGPGTVAAIKPNGKIAGKPVQAVKGKVTKPVEVDVAEEAGIALIGYVKAAGGTLQKAKVRMKVLTDDGFKGNSQLAKDVATFLSNDDNLKTLDGIDYSIKSGAISLSE